VDMRGKICVVTGANSGIGKSTARVLAEKGATVVMACRNMEKGEKARQELSERVGEELVLMELDLASLASIRAFAERFGGRYERLDVLVNNAGIYLPSRQETEEGYESTFGINHLGTFALTMGLLDKLKAAPTSRVVTVASAAHRVGHIDFKDLHSERHYRPFKVYGTAKLANILFGYELARRLEGTTVTSNSLHPGVVATNFAQSAPSAFGAFVKLGGPFLIGPDRGAKTSIYLASSPQVEGRSGHYYIRSKAKMPSQKAQNQNLLKDYGKSARN